MTVAPSEFDLIRRWFSHCGASRADVALGVGDDAAILAPPPGRQLCASIDTLVAGVHFRVDTDPVALGHKALAVNLSDLAATGADPAWAMLALTLPSADESWLEGFAGGFCALAREYGVELIGGDTTRGPLSITVQVQGFVPEGQALRRDGARAGDTIHVTGTLGDAGLALRFADQAPAMFSREDLDWLRSRLDRPAPRVTAGLALRGRARAAIDVSDGLLADLGHILAASGVGATLWMDRLPLSAPFLRGVAALARADGVSEDNLAATVALCAGDDYELCFTAAAEAAISDDIAGTRCAAIGVIDAEPGLRCLRRDGSAWQPASRGFDHFGSEAAR